MVLARMNRRKKQWIFPQGHRTRAEILGRTSQSWDRAGDQFNLVTPWSNSQKPCASMATQLRPITTRVECCWICGAMQRQNLSSKLLRVLEPQYGEAWYLLGLIEKAAGMQRYQCRC